MRNFAAMKNAFGGKTAKTGKYSVGIVNNKNGKRVTISASLATALGIQDAVYFIIDADNKELLVSADFPYAAAVKTKASGVSGEKRIVYLAAVVEAITQHFQLDFTTKTSRSFYDVQIDTDEDTSIPYAVVKIAEEVPVGGVPSEDQTEDHAHFIV